MACLTVREVVSGPGVSSSGSPVSEAARGEMGAIAVPLEAEVNGILRPALI